MLERYADVQSRKEKFLLNLYAQVGIGVFRGVAERELEEYGFHPQSIKELFSEYYEAPKRLGTIEEESLSLLTLQALTFADYPKTPVELRPQLLELAGSTAWESAYMLTRATHNSINGVDHRLDMIDVYETVNIAARQAYGEESKEHHRLTLRLALTQVLKDVVCGEISADTVEETRDALQMALAEVGKIQNSNDAQGVVGEIKVLQYFWDKYQKTGDLVAIPSTVRGGSGYFRPEETHDIDVIRQRKDRSWVTMSPIEAKKRQLSAEDFRRYARSMLAYVAPDGQVSISSWHRTRPDPSQDVAS
ncbi:hypothetical protein H7142_03940 [Candidatus Saccharibacteria bacterium]|nr:hypothetical protein [Candidatus Saccharibacteria bacterium]